MELVKSKDRCCGCGACYSICPQKAISMNEDRYGYLYPKINKKLCVKCGMCEKICAYQDNHKFNSPIRAYAAITRNKKILLKSSSGGIFGSFATDILNNNGIVYGCIFDDEMNPKHIGIDNLENLYKIQGSKYVQSDVKDIFYKIKKNLLNGKTVLFSGTPCQVDALNFYLKKEYNNLITVDIICHGVPNSKFFKEYISLIENKTKTKVIDFKFRNKGEGWGLLGKIIFKKNGKVYEKVITSSESSYYSYFLKSEIYRESCYNCKYACKKRVGDFTIGDYWGVEKEHPEIFSSKEIKIDNGVSLILINTAKAEKYLTIFQKDILLIQSTLEKIAKHNNQLNKCSKHTNLRKKLLEIYEQGGYKAIDKFYKKNAKYKIYIIKIRNKLYDISRKFY